MKNRKERLAGILIIALLLGSLWQPSWGVAAEVAPVAEGTGMSETAGAIDGPASNPTSTPAVTAKPALEPRPGAVPLLGSESWEKIQLTIGDQGCFDIDRNDSQAFSSDILSRLTKVEYQSNDSSVLQLDQEGNYRAVGIGTTTVTATGYDENTGEQLFRYTYAIVVYPDMSGVTLEKDSVILYHTYDSYSTEYVRIKINSSYVLDEQQGSVITVQSSNGNMFIYYDLSENILTLACDDKGSTQLTVIINGKEFVIHLRVVYVRLSRTSLLLAQKKGTKLKLRGTSEKAKWSSSNKKAVSVNSKGKLKAKKPGNAIIKVKIGNCTLGCVVSVVTPRKKKVIDRALKIARTSEYSQARRMQKGYYDCSSLVWRAYAPSGYTFGARGNAPTAASEGQWLEGRKKMVKGGYSRKNVQKLKLQAGDLLFRTGAKNGRYRGIYHVEMIVGYEFYGFDSKGKAVVASKWATKPDGYYAFGSGIVGRP